MQTVYSQETAGKQDRCDYLIGKGWVTTDPYVKQELSTLSNNSEWPGIYCICLVDNGESGPTKAEWTEAIEAVEPYMSIDGDRRRVLLVLVVESSNGKLRLGDRIIMR